MLFSRFLLGYKIRKDLSNQECAQYLYVAYVERINNWYIYKQDCKCNLGFPLFYLTSDTNFRRNIWPSLVNLLKFTVWIEAMDAAFCLLQPIESNEI